MRIYPLQFEKIYKENIWGQDEIERYNYKSSDNKKVGEVWLLSDALPKSIVKNGELKGKDFTYVMSHYAKNLIGEDRFNFPYTVKFIKAKEDLSLQVHPSNKSEAMYITSNNSKILGGAIEDLSKKDIENSPKLLQEKSKLYELNEGDIAYIAPGTLHSLLGGSECFEVSDNFDVTYRLYDFERGRELNLKQGLDSLILKSDIEIHKNSLYDKKIKISKQKVEGRKIIEEDENYKIIIPLEGKLSIETNTDFFDMPNNEVTLVPYEITGYSIVGFGSYLDISPNNSLLIH